MKQTKNKSFSISNNKGFHITFENGWTVSVQFGAGNYCDNYHSMDFLNPKPATSNTAEVWSWNDKRKQFFPKDPLGWQTAEAVIKFINKVRRKK